MIHLCKKCGEFYETKTLRHYVHKDFHFERLRLSEEKITALENELSEMRFLCLSDCEERAEEYEENIEKIERLEGENISLQNKVAELVSNNNKLQAKLSRARWLGWW